MYSGIDKALGLSWRPGARKLMVVVSDAPPLSPEPISGLTAGDLVARSLAIDPVELHFVAPGSAELDEVARRTNGSVRAGDAGRAAEAALGEALDKPFAWAGGPYVGRVGEELTLDGRGSYPAVTWEWDLDGDGAFDASGPVVRHAWAAPYDGLVTLRVTDADGRVALATAVAHVTPDGDEVDAGDNCPEAANADQSDHDGDGRGDACDPTPGYPVADSDGVAEEGPADAPPPGSAQPAGSAPSPGSAPTPGSAPPASEPSGTAPPPGSPARLRVGRPRLSGDLRRIRVPLTCRGPGSCAGRIRARLAGGTARAAYRLAAGRHRRVPLATPRRARRLLRAGRRVRLTVVVKPRADRPTTRTVRLRAATPPRRAARPAPPARRRRASSATPSG
jgi:hypothetical protein